MIANDSCVAGARDAKRPSGTQGVREGRGQSLVARARHFFASWIRFAPWGDEPLGGAKVIVTF